MNYQFFSNIFRALIASEDVAVSIKDECLLTQVCQAKNSILTWFDHFFPACVEDVLNRSEFSCKPFFEVIADFPFLIEGREKKFLSFVASVAYYARYHKGSNIALDYNVVRIMASRYIDDFVWKQIVKDDDNEYFARSVNATLRLVSENKKGHACLVLTEELLPSWNLAFPKIMFN